MKRKGCIQRIFAGILSALVIIGGIQMPTFAATTETPDSYVENADAAYYEPNLNYIDVIQEEAPQPIMATPSIEKVSASYTNESALPSSYRTPNLPAIRNQNPYGTCWAFSSTALAEISIMRHEGTALDLGELQLAYFMYNSTTDPLGLTEGDSNRNGEDDFLDLGGNLIFSMQTLAGWSGSVLESDVPYSSASTVLANGLDPEYGFTKDVAHLRNAYYLPMSDFSSTTSDRSILKNWIQTYGAIGVSYYHNRSYYNSTYNSYYNSVNTGTNHAISVVGWDDDFPASNFITTAPGNGAWLICNSWGSNTESMFGYFWISYYDTSLASSNAFVFDFVSDQNSTEDEYYDNNYQYDGAADSSYICTGTITTAANVFTATNNEIVKAVMVGAGNGGVNYTIKVYTDLEDESKPDSGTVASTESGTFDFSGMHTVKLSTSVPVLKGETYAVVVTLNGGTSYAYMMTETSCNYWIVCTAAAKAGQSFNKNGTTWVDHGARYGENIRIKALTDNANGISKPTVSVTGVSINESSQTIYLGGSLQLTKVISPSNATNKKVTWSSSNSDVATVSETGLVTSKKAGTTNIKVTTADGGFTDTITITVKQKTISGISLYAPSEKLYIGDSAQVTYTTTPVQVSATDITWTSSDTSVLTVSKSGKVTAVGVGTAQISGSCEGYSNNCQVTVYVDSTVKAYYTSDTSITLTWKPQANVSIQLTPYGADGTKYSAIDVNVTSGSYVDTAASSRNISYYYVAYSYPRGALYFYVYPELTKPTVTAAATTSGVKLSWNKVYHAEGYRVYRCVKGEEGCFYTIATTTNLNCVDTTDLEQGVTYTYRVYPMENGWYTWDLYGSVDYKPLQAASFSLANAANGVTISWSKVSDATGYVVYRKVSGGSYSKLATINSGSTVKYVDTTAASGTTYVYTVRVYRGSQYSTVDGKSIMRLAAPTTTVANSATGVTVKWNKIAGATGYYVYRKLDGGSYSKIATISSGSTTSYTDTKATAGKTSYYYVKAVNGSYTSGYSSASIVYLAAPATKLANATTGVKVTWSKTAGATGYYVYRKLDGGSYSKIATVKGAATVSYTDTKATSGKKYYYYVKAINDSTSSGTVTASILYLAAPTAKLANATAGVTVTWSKTTGATGYYVYRKLDGGSYAKIATVKGATTVSYTDKSAEHGKTYYYIVKAYNGSTVSGYTAVTTFRMKTPAVSSLANSSKGALTVKWSKSSSVTGYQIYYTDGSTSKTITVKGASNVSTTISSLKKGTTYKVRIRTYKTVSGVKYYSAWSSYKSLKLTK